MSRYSHAELEDMSRLRERVVSAIAEQGYFQCQTSAHARVLVSSLDEFGFRDFRAVGRTIQRKEKA